MKKILLLIGILLGTGGTWLYLWMKPPSDPYFFLSPKISEDHPIDIPIELYKNGDYIDFIFWKAPLTKPKLFYLFPISPPSSHIVLRIDKDKDKNINFFKHYLFLEEGPIGDIGDTPIFEVKIYRVNSDLSESLVFDKIHKKNNSASASGFDLVDLSGDYFTYGQYRLKVKVLGDWPELKISGLNYFITIKTYFVK
ncbi:hypothetical protein [Pectobacterium versatile]|uniref:hypothetical protein n=1 Tax=Pectobacterium versatile TaxID=2488639 RepID=UPI000F8F25EA|nr:MULTISPECIES: hypothetical protein [Pectobacterium]MCL6373983.1 hypothetical protein [Pectobacterium atrosepticum]RUR92501.1 hypothetical protein PB16LOC_02033 [Pectobacterium versatile]TAI88967.1 hypothetical protein EG330_01795 [Pectobacterium versatile]